VDGRFDTASPPGVRTVTTTAPGLNMDETKSFMNALLTRGFMEP
jgi:hypothetical protein